MSTNYCIVIYDKEEFMRLLNETKVKSTCKYILKGLVYKRYVKFTLTSKHKLIIRESYNNNRKVIRVDEFIDAWKKSIKEIIEDEE